MATAVEAANHIFISPSRFRDLVGTGVISRMPAGRYVLDKVRQEYCLNAQRIMAGRAADGGASLSAQRARLAMAQAEAAELKNAVSRGDFIPLREVEMALAGLFGAIRENVLGLPGKLADALAPLTAKDRVEVHQILRRECRELLTGLSSPDMLAQAGAHRPADSEANADDTGTTDELGPVINRADARDSLQG
jgi:phage terminase Nu1 subunit (DNA packaging protein)